MLIQDTDNFKISKFACRCCGKLKLSTALLYLAQMLRTIVGLPLLVNSGYRCEKHNKAVGGADDSRHLHGDAVDLHLLAKDKTPEKLRLLWHWADKVNPNGGVGLYDWGVHIDTRGHRARWDYRSDKMKKEIKDV